MLVGREIRLLVTSVDAISLWYGSHEFECGKLVIFWLVSSPLVFCVLISVQEAKRSLSLDGQMPQWPICKIFS